MIPPPEPPCSPLQILFLIVKPINRALALEIYIPPPFPDAKLFSISDSITFTSLST